MSNATADVRKVGEREGEIYGLYHHGQDPDAPGYTFAELLHLSRSVVTPQRLTALRAVTSILKNVDQQFASRALKMLEILAH